MDSYGKKAGKGALINENLAMTLGVSQDQTLFVPRGGWCIGNGQVAQTKLYDKCICLNCMHDQIAVLVKRRER